MNPKQILLYNADAERVNVEVTFDKGNFWLTQIAMAELFAVKVPAINKHLKHIFETQELDENSTISILEIVQQEGNRDVKRSVAFHRLDAVLAVGYRVNSAQATQFRKWATQTLNDFIIKGLKGLKKNKFSALQILNSPFLNINPPPFFLPKESCVKKSDLT